MKRIRLKNGLSFFERGHRNGEPADFIVVIGFHPPWSITWLWAVWWDFPRWRSPFGRFRFAKQAGMPKKRRAGGNVDTV